MKLYKFRPLSNFERVLDIALHQRLYCAPFRELNDPFEGSFLALSHFPSISLQAKGITRQILQNAAYLSEFEKVERVCSLSKSFKDVRLWSHYAEGHTGIAIELDFSNHTTDASPVEYLTTLGTYPNNVLGLPSPEKVLLQKTVHWQYETEWRILQQEPYYPILGRISAIYLGRRVSENHKSLLNQLLPKEIPIIHTNINLTTLDVQPSKTFPRS